jgi:hypothetical protein
MSRTLCRYRPLTVAAPALALALAMPEAPVRGQMPFPVAPDPIMLIVPLLLTVLGLRMAVSRSDAERVRQLESRGDWDQLDTLIKEHLAARPCSGRLEKQSVRDPCARSARHEARCGPGLQRYLSANSARVGLPLSLESSPPSFGAMRKTRSAGTLPVSTR